MALLVSVSLTAKAESLDTVELDIPYVPNGDHKQQLDLYTPGENNFPTILFVHGGSLTTGDRKESPYPQMCKTFQELGIGCAAMSYRLAPEFKWPAQPDDVVAAFAWLKHNISARGGDSSRVFLFGHSSGCLLVSIVATDSKYLEKIGLSQKDVAGVISLGCRLNDVVEITATPPLAYETSWVPPDRIADYMKSETAYVDIQQRKDVVPASHVDANLPLTLVLMGEEERFFPPVLRDAAEFVGRALTAGAKADISILDNRRHMTAIEMMVTPEDPTVVTVANFVRER